MIIKRFSAVLTAIVMTCAMASCSKSKSGSSSSETNSTTSTSASETSTSAASSSAGRGWKDMLEKNTGTSGKTDTETLSQLPMSYEPVSLDDVRSHAQQLMDDIEITDNYDKVKKDVDTLIADIDACSDAYSRIMVDYYLDFQNEELEALYDSSFETEYVASEIVKFALCHCCKKPEYKALAEKHVDPDEVEAYTARSVSMKRVEGYAKVDFALNDERLDAYYDIYEDEDMPDSEKALKCAELYLDLLANEDADGFYGKFNRDYSPETILELCDVINKELSPISDKLILAFQSCPSAYDVIYDPKTFDDPFTVIRKYAPSLSGNIKDAADKICDNDLYFITDDSDAFPGSFTTSLPLTHNSVIFMNTSEDQNSLTTAVHEFGHYYASLHDDTSSYDSIANLDIAEVQSHGFEMLFTQFYDKIYEDQSEAMQLYKVFDMLDSVISGFLIGKFEYTVLSQLDDMTPEKVVECWHDVMGDYTDKDFFYVNHLFEQPGYYISYGTSALAAFDLWEDCIYDTDEALKKYEKFAAIKCSSPDVKFCDALKECGFHEVLDKEYVKVLAAELSDYADEIIEENS
jgi:hypothetical protein